MRLLFLDDDPIRHKRFADYISGKMLPVVGDSVDFCFTAQEAIDLMKKNQYDILHLDHDLGGRIYVNDVENTGFEVVLWMEANLEDWPDQIIIHTFNPSGAQRMMEVLKRYSSRVYYVPFNY